MVVETAHPRMSPGKIDEEPEEAVSSGPVFFCCERFGAGFNIDSIIADEYTKRGTN